MNISAKFELHPPYGFWDDFFVYIFRKFILSIATNQIQRFGQNLYSYLAEDYSRNTSVKFCQNICSEIAKMSISTFPIVSQWPL